MTRSPASLDTLLTALKERAGRSAAEARALPPDLYRSEELFALEQERIFSKEWLCAGRADEIPEPGDYLTYAIAEQPVVVIRQRDASLRAFARCRRTHLASWPTNVPPRASSSSSLGTL